MIFEDNEPEGLDSSETNEREILSLLNRYQPAEGEGYVSLFRVLDFLLEGDRWFDTNSFSDGHITGSAFIVDPRNNRTLLTHHTKLNIWVQLGGHADGDFDIRRVAMKEAQEESGLNHLDFISDDIFDLDVHLIPERTGIPSHYHYDVRFLIQGDSSEKLIVSEESHDLAWVDINEIEKYTKENSVIRMCRKWTQRESGLLN